MVELFGGVLMILGGGLVTAASLPRRTAIESARELLGNSDAAIVQQLPAPLGELLDRLD